MTREEPERADAPWWSPQRKAGPCSRSQPDCLLLGGNVDRCGAAVLKIALPQRTPAAVRENEARRRSSNKLQIFKSPLGIQPYIAGSATGGHPEPSPIENQNLGRSAGVQHSLEGSRRMQDGSLNRGRLHLPGVIEDFLRLSAGNQHPHFMRPPRADPGHPGTRLWLPNTDWIFVPLQAACVQNEETA